MQNVTRGVFTARYVLHDGDAAAGSKLGDGQVAACRDPALTGEVHHYDHQDAEDSQDLKAALPTG